MAMVKEGHVAATVSGPARGKMGPIMWTFKGVMSQKDLAKGAPNSYWQKTSNGWPDQVTLRAWGDLMISEKKERGLAKMLIFVDNAAIHCDLELCAKLAANKITLLGLIPSATSKVQPLDLKFFGGVKAKMPVIASRLGIFRCYSSVAELFELCVAELEKSASKGRTSVLAAGFKAAGLVPWNPDIHGDASFAASDLRLGIKKGDAAVKAATARGEAVSQQIIDEVVFSHQPEGVQKLTALADAKRAARLAAAKGTGTTDEGAIDGHGSVLRAVYTSVAFQQAAADKLAAAEASKVAAKLTADARAAAAAANRARDAERSANHKAKLAEGKAKREAAAAAKAAKAAEKAAKAAPPPKPVAKRKAKGPVVDDDAYARPYVKRAKK